jgi:hypothetical protein
VQAIAAPKNFNPTEIFGSGSLETRNQLYRQRNCRPVRELDPQCTLLGAVRSKGSSRFCFTARRPAREARAKFARSSFSIQPGIRTDLRIQTERLGCRAAGIVPNSRQRG